MNTQIFVEKINKYIIDENDKIYRELFTNTKIENVKDEYWKQAQLLFNSLSEENKEVFFKIIHQIMVDTISTLLGTIDGVIDLGYDDFDFSLKEKDNVLSGDLQDYFLSLIEEKKSY